MIAFTVFIYRKRSAGSYCGSLIDCTPENSIFIFKSNRLENFEGHAC
jgi:hypothetical protein